MTTVLIHEPDEETDKIWQSSLHYHNLTCTGKSFSEALFLPSINPQFHKRLFIELRVQWMKIPNSEHVVYTGSLDNAIFGTGKKSH